MHVYITGRYGNGQTERSNKDAPQQRATGGKTELAAVAPKAAQDAPHQWATGYKMQYVCFTKSSTGATACNYGELLGSKPETELQVIQIALKYAYANNEDITVHTDFANVQKRVNGRIKATSRSAKDFAAFASMVREKINIQVVEELPDRERKVLDYILDNISAAKPHDGWQWCKVTWATPSFRVVVRDSKGKVLCDFNEKHFGGVLADAIYFANWCERESKNEKSNYFGIKVERYNVPPDEFEISR